MSISFMILRGQCTITNVCVCVWGGGQTQMQEKCKKKGLWGQKSLKRCKIFLNNPQVLLGVSQRLRTAGWAKSRNGSCEGHLNSYVNILYEAKSLKQTTYSGIRF